MPPSGRKAAKTRTRRVPATEVQEPSDAETPEAIATPSRSSRKRARGTDNIAPASRNTRRKVKDTRAADREDTEGTEPQDPSDAETEPAAPGEAEIIAHLKVADRHVNATEDFANDLLEGQENVPGYGKIAGRDWAFIIRKVEINIGRPEAQERLAVHENGNGQPQQQPEGPSAKILVDIDLGPDRQVSRSHAIISYDSDSQRWFIIVNGRNGLRIDNNLLKRGAKSYLRNGSVIEIANTQMAFITTPAEEGEEPIFDASIIRQAQKSSEEDDEGEDDPRNNGFRAPGHTAARSQLSNSAMYGDDQNGGQQRRTHPHSQQNQMAAPGTPMRTQNTIPKSSPMANYARGVMMESTETIDYSADTAKDLKPPHSYAQLIGMAILSTPEQQMTLNNIYNWIMANYAFYRYNTGGWQNSIRHNLSLNKAFTKIARRTDEPGKGMKWMIEPTEYDNFVQQGMKGCRRPNPMPGTQSTLGSPHSPMNIMRHAGAGPNGIKTDTSPPLTAYRPAFPTATEAYTPDRGPRPQQSQVGLGINGNANGNPETGGPEYDYLTRSTPRNSNGLTAIANLAGSPPALFVSDEGRAVLDTPYPLRPNPRLAPPSTLKRPSDYIQFSSPAPFWKMEGLAGSTPFKPFDLSPMKSPFEGFKKAEAEAKEEDSKVEAAEGEGEGKKSPVIPSSSPPIVRTNGNGAAQVEEDEEDGDLSPTLSRPASAVAKTLSQLAAASASASASTSGEKEVNGNNVAQPTPPPSQPVQDTALKQSVNGPVNGTNGPNGYPQAPPVQQQNYAYTAPPNQTNGYHHPPAPVADDGDDEGIDLAK
jgi:forkhead protein FKH